MNSIRSWEIRNDEDDESALIRRTAEIQKLQEEIIPNAVKNLHKAQDKQETTQNKQKNVIYHFLQPNNQVFIKTEKIQGKFEQCQEFSLNRFRLHLLNQIQQQDDKREPVYLQRQRYNVLNPSCIPVLACRPVVESDLRDEAENDSKKILDIYTDEPLFHYLSSGKHLSGLSSKQVKMVERQASHFIYDHDTEEIFMIDKNGFTLLVSKPCLRNGIIEKAHALGHFQKEATVRRIKEHFWKKLVKDVENYISSCDVCKRNNNISPKELPAKTLAIKGVVDSIGKDLVFGLPETKEGYIGLFFVSEYLTKFPYVEPVKGKTAVKIAEKLWNFICLFGPSKSCFVGSRYRI
ncbi:unnamed protein product [Brachionus calyciflorus]|uniref:Integrase zinc-binding domain-containing protein n=1 Tax=Brachionus calyciflorus TaxID=104777 RepID=A0A814G819_9BILA|nr:unnamed protein product [Brachionus calyciflorus]